jgi:DNA invertase Pin-like site-specific DNA recombinase
MTDISNSIDISFRKVESSTVGIANTCENVSTGQKDNIIQFYAEGRNKPQKEESESEGLTALYVRLSVDDGTEGESNSIANQKKMLERYCRDHAYSGIYIYEDDGYSGTNFDRPGFQKMLNDVKAGRIARIVVKDMSRLGRDYLQVGMFTDILFPEFGVHFIAVGDGVDSKKGDSEFTAIRNIFNEMYARDTSKKIKSVLHSKGKSGGRLSPHPPYGYIKDPDVKGKWLVDEEAAAVVQKVFSLCVGGMGPHRIAKWLRDNEVLCPSAYFMSKGISVPCKPTNGKYWWTTITVCRMLDRLEYLGYTVNFKYDKPSYKSKKVISNTPDEWQVFEGTQEPIIEGSVFQVVQDIRKSKQKRRPAKSGKPPLFSGLVYCGDCGGRMYHHRTSSPNPNVHALMCSTYRRSIYYEHEVNDCTTHYIKVDVLKQIVGSNLREAVAHVSRYGDEFIRAVTESETAEQQRMATKKQKALIKTETRISEIDGIIQNLYEDNVNGKLSDARFVKLSGDYEREQDILKRNAEEIRKAVKEYERSKSRVNDFIDLTKKYIDMKEPDSEILREFIKRINVYERDKKAKTQRVEIVYNFIGRFDFEDFGKAIAHSKQTENQITKEKAV